MPCRATAERTWRRGSVVCPQAQCVNCVDEEGRGEAAILCSMRAELKSAATVLAAFVGVELAFATAIVLAGWLVAYLLASAFATLTAVWVYRARTSIRKPGRVTLVLVGLALAP